MAQAMQLPHISMQLTRDVLFVPDTCITGIHVDGPISLPSADGNLRNTSFVRGTLQKWYGWLYPPVARSGFDIDACQ